MLCGCDGAVHRASALSCLLVGHYSPRYRAPPSGFLYFLANDPSIPEATRSDVASFGLCGDTVPFWGPGAFPTQLYVREGLRIVGDYVATQANTGACVCVKSVGADFESEGVVVVVVVVGGGGGGGVSF